MNGRLIAKRYRISRFLSEGGMGSVHEAEDEVTGERVAVKLVRESALAGRRAAEAANRFRREARAAAAATGENVVRVLEDGVDEESGELFIVMELLEGEDLQQIIERTGPLAPDLALRIAGQALRGLHRAHEAAIVHRDIKPANIFLARKGGGEQVVKILDFGVAKMLGEGRELGGVKGLTTTGNFLGSPLFMSPEQVKSSKHVDLRADIWSIGSALYCALAGRAPHEAAADSVGKLILAICNSPARPVHEVAPWVPVAVSQVLARALDIDPSKRFASAAEMADALRPFAPDLTLREDMWRGLPVLVSVPPLPQDGDTGASIPRPAQIPSLASAETVLDLESERRPVAVTEEAQGPSKREAAPPASPKAIADDLASTTQKSMDLPSSPAVRRDAVGPRRALLVFGAVLLLGGGAAALWRGAPESSPSLSGAVSAIPATTSAAVVPSMLRFPLRISPADAAVLVDGAPVQSVAGNVEIAGAAGQMHDVQVSKEGAAVRASVLITEKGLSPPAIELVPAATPMLPSATPAASSARGPEGARVPVSRPTGVPSAKQAPSKEPVVAPPSPPPTPTVPKPPEDDLMQDHR